MADKIFRYLLFFLVMLAVPAMQVAEAADNKYKAVSTAGNVYELSIGADTLEVMKPLPVTIAVSNQAGAPLAEVKISCALTMPAMAMPSNKPPIKASGQAGQYEGIFLFTMGGLWHVEITALYSSGEQDTTLIPLAVASSGQAKDKSVDTQLEELFHKQGEAKLK